MRTKYWLLFLFVGLTAGLIYWLELNSVQPQESYLLNEQGIKIEYEIKDKPVVKITTPPPSLDRPKDSQGEVRFVISNLKKNPSLFGEWLNLGLYRKQFEDYEGALEAFQYAALLRPEDARPFSNMANLYGYYLKKFDKAEEMFLAGIKLEANSVNLYFDTYQFFRDVLKDKDKSVNIVKQALVANPDDPDLKKLLEEATL